MSSQARETKAKINKCDCIKLKSFCTGNRTININTMKRPPTERGVIFINYIFDKVLISKIHKELIQFNMKNKKPNKKMGRSSEYTFF